MNHEQIKLVQETKIMQKVNRVKREAFADKFPTQIEHCLRLTMERLQLGLDKRSTNFDVTNPDTWLITPLEIRDLAETARILNDIRRGL